MLKYVQQRAEAKKLGRVWIMSNTLYVKGPKIQQEITTLTKQGFQFPCNQSAENSFLCKTVFFVLAVVFILFMLQVICKGLL